MNLHVIYTPRVALKQNNTFRVRVGECDGSVSTKSNSLTSYLLLCQLLLPEPKHDKET